MDETVPLLIVAAAAVIAVRWLFSKTPEGDAVPEERVLQQVMTLQNIFPNVPVQVIREELVASQFRTQICIDRLLHISGRYVPSTTTLEHAGSPVETSVSTEKSKSDGMEESAIPMIDPATVDRATWEKNAQVRQALLRSRKAAMLKAARERLKNACEEGGN
jgi:hypothetical protein